MDILYPATEYLCDAATTNHLTKIFVVDLQSTYVSCNVTILYKYCRSISTVPCVLQTLQVGGDIHSQIPTLVSDVHQYIP